MSVRAGPGVVYVAIKRIFDTEQAVGLAIRQMFCELTVSEAVAVHKQLGEVIGIALASAQEPSGLDGGARL